MLNLNSIMIGSNDPKKLADFYANVFGEHSDIDPEENDEWFGWMAGGCYFTIGPHSEVNGKAKEPERILLNFETDEVKEEFDRLVKEGAKVIKEPYEADEGMWVATLADPDGNYFQLVTPWKENEEE